MDRKKKSPPARYDLPSSRVLIRSLRCKDRRLEAIGPPPDRSEAAALDERVQRMILDLFMVRLMETRGILPEYHLSGGKRTDRLEQGYALDKLAYLNEWAGFELFDLAAWRDPGPGEELAELDHEIHLNRFWPMDMPSEVLGALWEERIPMPRRSGVYYTPRAIVDRVLDFALTPLIDGGPRDLFILDPAAGSGYFLIEAFRRVIEKEASSQSRDLFAPMVKSSKGPRVLDPAFRMQLLSDHIFGVDIDGQALELARRSLFLEAVSWVSALDHPAPDAKPLFANLRQGDAIVEESLPQQVDLFEPTTPPPLMPFDWKDQRAGFARVMEAGGFTCVVGNPPWVSLKGRHKQAPYTPAMVGRLIESYRADTYRPNVVEFFIRRAVGLLADNGLHSFVVPDRVAENDQYIPLRDYMAHMGELLRLHFREPFPGVAADTLIYLFRKKTGTRKSRILVTDVSGEKFEAPQGYWTRAEGLVPVDANPKPIEDALKKIDLAGRRPLSDFLETGVGFIAKARRITQEQKHENQHKVIKGEHVTPYRRDGQAWFEFTIANLAGGTRNLDKLQRPERILLRKTGARLIAAIDKSGDLPEQSVYFAFFKDRRLAKPYQLEYFLGILNSRVMSFYFRHRKITNRATTPQIKKVHLDSLPIRPIQFNNRQAKALHDSLCDLVKKRTQSIINDEKSSLNDKIDETVAELYGLDESDLKLIKSETAKGWE